MVGSHCLFWGVSWELIGMIGLCSNKPGKLDLFQTKLGLRFLYINYLCISHNTRHSFLRYCPLISCCVTSNMRLASRQRHCPREMSSTAYLCLWRFCNMPEDSERRSFYVHSLQEIMRNWISGPVSGRYLNFVS